jgi:hypothetical protein
MPVVHPVTLPITLPFHPAPPRRSDRSGGSHRGVTHPDDGQVEERPDDGIDGAAPERLRRQGRQGTAGTSAQFSRPEVRAALAANIPLGRPAEPEELVDAYLLLLGPGSTILVDGGLSAL